MCSPSSYSSVHSPQHSLSSRSLWRRGRETVSSISKTFQWSVKNCVCGPFLYIYRDWHNLLNPPQWLRNSYFYQYAMTHNLQLIKSLQKVCQIIDYTCIHCFLDHLIQTMNQWLMVLHLTPWQAGYDSRSFNINPCYCCHSMLHLILPAHSDLFNLP